MDKLKELTKRDLDCTQEYHNYEYKDIPKPTQENIHTLVEHINKLEKAVNILLERNHLVSNEED